MSSFAQVSDAPTSEMYISALHRGHNHERKSTEYKISILIESFATHPPAHTCFRDEEQEGGSNHFENGQYN